jgi:hypothetical protein
MGTIQPAISKMTEEKMVTNRDILICVGMTEGDQTTYEIVAGVGGGHRLIRGLVKHREIPKIERREDAHRT